MRRGAVILTGAVYVIIVALPKQKEVIKLPFHPTVSSIQQTTDNIVNNSIDNNLKDTNQWQKLSYN
jgi:hypothetical protein